MGEGGQSGEDIGRLEGEVGQWGQGMGCRVLTPVVGSVSLVGLEVVVHSLSPHDVV